MNKKISLALIFSLGLIFSSAPIRVSAQTVENSVEVSGEVSVDPTSTGETGTSPEPTGWRLFFLGVRERLSLMTTFDPVAKAEKALKFAEERAKIAERLAEKTDNPKAHERINKMLERAGKLEDQADKVRDTLIDNPDARAQLLLKNLLNFKEHKEGVFSKLEEKLTPEQFERLQNMRKEAEEKSNRLMNALENSDIPEEVRAHLESVKAKIEEHQEEVKQFKEEQKALLDRIKAGDESAKEQLETLREERRDELRLNTGTQTNTTSSFNRMDRRPQVRPVLPLQERPQN